MYRIAFFSIYAYGHTNPTLAVVRALTALGHQVRYYSFAPFRAGIEAVGEATDPAALGPLPAHITVRPRVDQLAVLARFHVFLSHCGMNSVSESLYLGVPLVLFPQQQEQALVARRAAQLGAGLLLKRAAPPAIRLSVLQVLGQPSYTACARAMSADLRAAGGARLGAEKILSAAEKWG